MKTVSMSGSRRESVGKKDAKRHRREGRVPCVVYGGTEEIHFTLEEKDLSKIIFTPETFFVKLAIDGKEYDCILKDVQYHPVSDQILHADFFEFDTEDILTVAIPIKVTGSAPGVIQGGKLIKKFRKLTVTGLASKLPEAIDVDVSKLQINDKIVIGDLKLDGITVKEKPEQFVIKVSTTRMAASMAPGEEAEEAAEGAEGEGEAAAEGASEE